jgi:hypothetical protein
MSINDFEDFGLFALTKDFLLMLATWSAFFGCLYSFALSLFPFNKFFVK